uniref:Uncharacterized protein n=2 Tax=Aegilops tauschii subsp. strangulata TaxID=200361 RepID=A0A453S581_AEGTS
WFVCKSMQTCCCDGWGAEVAASSAFTLDHAVWLWVARAHGPVFPTGCLLSFSELKARKEKHEECLFVHVARS